MSGVQIPIPPQTFFLPSRRHDNIFPVQYANGPTKYPRTRVEALIRFESGFARHLSNMFFQILRVINLEMNGQIRNYRLKLVVVVQWTRNSLTVVYVIHSVLLRPAPSLGWAEEAREDLQRSSGSHTGIEPRAG